MGLAACDWARGGWFGDLRKLTADFWRWQTLVQVFLVVIAASEI
jgi:hypothetical protein